MNFFCNALRTGWFAVSGIILIHTLVFAQLPPESQWQEEGVCARVRIRISQDVAITRTAFRATLEIDNAVENVPIENVAVAIDIRNENQEESNDLFAIRDPELTGISDMSGNGALEPGSSAKAVWIIIPTRDAAPDKPEQYYVGGTLSYIESDTEINMPLFPAAITVKPDPLLTLNYFLVRNVYSDDPFTKDVIEPAEPFSLGLMMSNQGKGIARNVKITSAQPEIIENEKGLLIDFKIIGTQVNTDQVTPSLTVDLGDIGAGQTSVAQWLMTSSLQGKFVEYKPDFEHVDELGEAKISLIDSVKKWELNHVVRVDIEDDGKPDFLVNDFKDDNFLPDKLYNSDGSTSVVNVVSDAVVSGPVSGGNLQVTLTGNAPNGWVYIRVEDPGQEQFVLKRVVRSDGQNIRLDDNAWTTHRTIRLDGESPYRESLLHLFDHIETGSFEYALTFEGAFSNPEPPVMQFIPDRSMVAGVHFGFIVKASDPNKTIPSISAAPIPEGATFMDNGDGEARFDWPTALEDVGEHEITFTASDGALQTSQTALITIYSDKDEDGDNMPDDWEQEHFTTLARDGHGDFDEDGISDLNEWLNRTDPVKTVKGDVNNDETVDLTDMMLALRILTGIPPETIVSRGSDVNGDGKIGLEDLIYILKMTAGDVVEADWSLAMVCLAGEYELIGVTMIDAVGTEHEPNAFSGEMIVFPNGEMSRTLTVDGETASGDVEFEIVNDNVIHFSSVFSSFNVEFELSGDILTITYPKGCCNQTDFKKIEVWKREKGIPVCPLVVNKTGKDKSERLAQLVAY